MEQEQGHGGKDQAEMNARLAKGRQARRGHELGALRVVRALRVFPDAEDEEVRQQHGDVIEQEGGDGLADPTLGPQKAGDRRPEPAAQENQDEHQGEQDIGGQAGERQRAAGGKDGAEIELPLGADVDEPDPRGQGRGQAVRTRGIIRTRTSEKP